MTDLSMVPFLFEGDSLIRVADQNGDPWFVASDICRVLGIKQTSRAVEPLDPNEKGVISIHTPGGPQDLLVVCEGGLYTLILRSRAATTPGTLAHRFRRWVTTDLLPTIRKAGKYERPGKRIHDTEYPMTDDMKLRRINTAIRCFGARAGAELWAQYGFDLTAAMKATLAQKQFSFVVDLDESGPTEPAAVN